MKTQPTLFVVGGPTASGKTAAAIALAQSLNTEIVNVDSRQVYEELNIAVAKPSQEELFAVKHHGIGHVPIQYHYNAGTHAEIFRGITQELLQEKGAALLCGGTGLYIEAILYGMDDLPEVDPDLRSEILDQYVANAVRLRPGHECPAGELRAVVGSHRLRIPAKQRSAVQNPSHVLT